MINNVPVGLWLAAVGAAVFVAATVSVVCWRAPAGRQKTRVIAGLVLWLAVDFVLAAAGEFAASASNRVPFIIAGIAIPLVVGIVLLGRPGAFRRVLDAVPLPELVGVQVYRVVGVIFVIAWATGHMPAAFALPAGIGDIAVGMAAPFVARGLRPRSTRSRAVAVAWSIAGIADLVLAVALGFFTSPSPFQQLALGHPNSLITRMPFVLIPTFAVPLSVLLHLVALRRLGEGASHSPDRGTRPVGASVTSA